MNGAESLIKTAIEAGIKVCFANPGTTEMPLVSALDSVPGIKPILCLHENVATGAADGYARMSGQPAMTLLHLGPGLSNGLTNLHNARRAHTPIINVIGEHASWHLEADPPLNAPLDQIAGSVSGFVRKSASAGEMSKDMADAIAASYDDGGQVATLIAPHDAQIEEAEAGASLSTAPNLTSVPDASVASVQAALSTGKTAILLSGKALSEEGLRLAGKIAQATGADLICETFYAVMERGGDLPKPIKLPYFPDEADALLQGYDKVISVGAEPPVAFFGYPDGRSRLTTSEQDVVLAVPGQDVVDALARLADQLGATKDTAMTGALPPMPPMLPMPPMPNGPLTAEAVCTVIANLQPKDCIIMDEGLTASAIYHEVSNFSPRFTQLQLTGGAIGMGPGCATGAAMACPDRQVINLQADGSAAYSVQAWWTQARENLDVITILLSNRSYEILNIELARAGVDAPGPAATALASLDEPALDWVSIAKGFGVSGEAVVTAEDFAIALEGALLRRGAGKGPYLIEIQMP
ncbi:MAG: acetolactate synthase large subunit [Alphaproteobacteria bacterium]|nr:MAG: acetolactate synthase large subunit [Alphaproteobacteria bacterium]